jgi:hypothetical protein
MMIMIIIIIGHDCIWGMMGRINKRGKGKGKNNEE